MTRSALLDLLPDFSSGGRKTAAPRAPGFEPLVHAAGAREEFSMLGMSAGFAGVSNGSGNVGEQDPIDVMSDLTLDLDAGDETPSLDIANLSPDGDIPGAGLTTEAPAELSHGSPESVFRAEETDIEPVSSGNLTSDDESDAAAAGIATHELLEAAHRAEIRDIEDAHRQKIAELVSEKLPKIRNEVVEILTGELASLVAAALHKQQVANSLDALVAEIRGVLEGDDVFGFELHGPSDLIAAFKENWPDDDASVRYVVTDGIDLVARIDKTVIATRLSEVDRLIQEALS